MDDGFRRDHFGIEQRPARQDAMKRPAMPVGPIHHWGNTKSNHLIFIHFSVQTMD
jgi:hypothetical protein